MINTDEVIDCWSRTCILSTKKVFGKRSVAVQNNRTQNSQGQNSKCRISQRDIIVNAT